MFIKIISSIIKIWQTQDRDFINLRDEVIIVVDSEPISWKVAKLEIDHETKLGDEILKKLETLSII